MEAERKLFSAGRGRSAGDVSKSHAAAFAGTFTGGGGRKDRPAESRSLHSLPAGGIQSCASAEHRDIPDRGARGPRRRFAAPTRRRGGGSLHRTAGARAF